MGHACTGDRRGGSPGPCRTTTPTSRPPRWLIRSSAASPTARLPRDRFAGYIVQDGFFLEYFARAYALAIAQSPDRAGLDAFANLLNGVREELNVHASYTRKWGVDLSTVAPTPATAAYTDFLLATAALGGLGLTRAAMTPCMRLYAHLGQQLAGRPVSDHYAEWVNTYSDPLFEALATTLEELLDAYTGDNGPDFDKARVIYRRAMRLELGFFDTAWNEAAIDPA